MAGIQLPIGIETVNPVDADYKRGPWASIAAAKAGIPLALRYNNLSFYVVADPNEYYWLDTDLSDGGLLIRGSGGGSGLPIGQAQIVWVMAGGSDTTGDGTYPNPFLTINKALSVITDNSGIKRYTVCVGSKNIPEPSFNLKPFVWIQGMPNSSTRIDLTVQNIGLDSSFSTTTARCGMKDITLSGTFNSLDLDLQALGGVGLSCVVELFNVHLNGGVTWKARYSADTYEIWNSQVLGAMNMSGGNGVIKDCYCPNTGTFDNVGSSNNSDVIVHGTRFDSVTASDSGFGLTLEYSGGTTKTSLAVSGSALVLTTDIVSSTALSVTGGATVIYLGQAPSSSLPKVHYVYLVNDSSDAVLMGGAGSNVYTTAQAAYNAADVLSIGGTIPVIIQVGKTDATVGGITLTADWNSAINISGISMADSLISFINGDSAVGTAASLNIVLNNVTITNLSSSATGPVGDGGVLSPFGSNFEIGTIDLNNTDPANTGSTGSLQTAPGAGPFITAAVINTFNMIGTGASTLMADVYINFPNVTIGAINIQASGPLGAIYATNLNVSSLNVDVPGANLTLQDVFCFTANINTGANMAFKDCRFGNVTISSTASSTLLAQYCDFTEDLSPTGGSLDFVTTANGCRLRALTCTFANIDNLSNFSVLTDCSITRHIANIGTSCQLNNTAIMGDVTVAPIIGITNPTPVSVIVNNFHSRGGVAGTVSLVYPTIDISKINPPAIAVNTNNYAPTGFATTSRINVTSTASFSITGLSSTGIVDGQTIKLININAVGSGFDITISHESASSTAANRFLCTGNVDKVLTVGSFIILEYSTTLSRWCTQS